MNGSEFALNGIGIVIFCILLFVAILWVLLPLVVYQIRNLLMKTTAEMNQTIGELQRTQHAILKELQITNQILKAVHNVEEE